MMICQSSESTTKLKVCVRFFVDGRLLSAVCKSRRLGGQHGDFPRLPSPSSDNETLAVGKMVVPGFLIGVPSLTWHKLVQAPILACLDIAPTKPNISDVGVCRGDVFTVPVYTSWFLNSD